MNDWFRDKLCVVTGAAQGMGKTLAEKYAASGARLALLDLKGDALRETTAEIVARHGVSATPYTVDMSDFPAVREVMAKIGREHGAIQVMANCAGISTAGLLCEITEQLWDRVMNINLKSVFVASTLAARNMIDNKVKDGRIVTISSQASKIGELGNGSYSVSKAGVNMLTQVLGLELAEHGIAVTAVCPGYVDTEIMRQVFRERGPLEGMTPAEYEHKLTSMVPMRRMATPEEVAEFMFFLSSEKAGYITGVSLTIAGGKSLI